MMTFTADEVARGLSMWGATIPLVGGGHAPAGFVSPRSAAELEVGREPREVDESRLTGPRTPTEVRLRMEEANRKQTLSARLPTDKKPALHELARLKPASGTGGASERDSVPEELSWWSKVVATASRPSPLAGVPWGVVGAVMVGAAVAGVVVAKRGR